jgi:hypothetical protein
MLISEVRARGSPTYRFRNEGDIFDKHFLYLKFPLPRTPHNTKNLVKLLLHSVEQDNI